MYFLPKQNPFHTSPNHHSTPWPLHRTSIMKSLILHFSGLRQPHAIDVNVLSVLAMQPCNHNPHSVPVAELRHAGIIPAGLVLMVKPVDQLLGTILIYIFNEINVIHVVELLQHVTSGLSGGSVWHDSIQLNHCWYPLPPAPMKFPAPPHPAIPWLPPTTYQGILDIELDPHSFSRLLHCRHCCSLGLDG